MLERGAGREVAGKKGSVNVSVAELFPAGGSKFTAGQLEERKQLEGK